MSERQLTHDAHRTKRRQYPLCYLAHDMALTLNVGSLFRLADALGIEKMYLTGRSVTPPNDKIKRTSRATEKTVAFEYAKQPLPIIEHLKEQGYTIISLEITSSSLPLDELSLPHNEKVCLVIGAENKGINADLLSASDLTVHIPMQGSNSSMNVINACAIASYAISRQLS